MYFYFDNRHACACVYGYIHTGVCVCVCVYKKCEMTVACKAPL